MRTMYLIERYVVDSKSGTWSLVGNERFSEYDKRKVLADAKRKGYEYDRRLGAYVKTADNIEYTCDRAIRITRYEI